jgi:formylglycine-generating enzyme required for sulfatase activity
VGVDTLHLRPGDSPVGDVNWDDARLYTAWLKRITGKDYRLLTGAEWEYAARAGTKTAYWWGDDIGKGNADCYDCGRNYNYYSGYSKSDSFKPNAFGLYAMAGSIWQWLEDTYHNSYEGAPNDGGAWTTGGSHIPVSCAAAPGRASRRTSAWPSAAGALTSADIWMSASESRGHFRPEP